MLAAGIPGQQYALEAPGVIESLQLRPVREQNGIAVGPAMIGGQGGAAPVAGHADPAFAPFFHIVAGLLQDFQHAIFHGAGGAVGPHDAVLFQRRRQHGKQALGGDVQPAAHLHEAGLCLGGQSGPGVGDELADGLPELAIVAFFQLQPGPGDDRHQLLLHGIEPFGGNGGGRHGDGGIAFGVAVDVSMRCMAIPRCRPQGPRYARACAS